MSYVPCWSNLRQRCRLFAHCLWRRDVTLLANLGAAVERDTCKPTCPDRMSRPLSGGLACQFSPGMGPPVLTVRNRRLLTGPPATLDVEKQPRSPKTVVARPSELAIPAPIKVYYAVSIPMAQYSPKDDTPSPPRSLRPTRRTIRPLQLSSQNCRRIRAICWETSITMHPTSAKPGSPMNGSWSFRSTDLIPTTMRAKK